MKIIFFFKILLANPIFVSENKTDVTESYEHWKNTMLNRYNLIFPKRKKKEDSLELSFLHNNFGNDHKFFLKKIFPKSEFNFTGSYIFFTQRYQNNYGHVFHDHLPQIAWILKNSHENVFLMNTKLNQIFFDCFFSDYKKRIFFLDPGKRYFFNGTLSYFYLEKPRSYALERNNFFFHSAFLNEKKKNVCKANGEDLVIYCLRHPSQVNHKRLMDTENENEIIGFLSKKFKNKFLIFNGLNKKNEKMGITQQAELFSKASLVIGPHGSAMSNIGWMDWTNNPAVIEFVCTPESINVQGGCPFMKTYYWLFGMRDEIRYYHVGFTKNSNSKKTFVKISDLKKAVNYAISQSGPLK